LGAKKQYYSVIFSITAVTCNLAGKRETTGTGGGASQGGGGALRERERHNNRGDATTNKGEDMVEVVRKFWGLIEDKMGNVPRGGTCIGTGVGPRKLKIIALLFSDRYLQRSRPWKIN
jgi:hypothetical protein